MSRFVTTLRARPMSIRLAPPAAATVWTVRVQCEDAWDAVRMEVLPETSVRDAKHAAMTALLPDVTDTDGYVAKLRGIEVRDEGVSLQSAGAVDGSIVLVTSRRRRPVR